MAVLKTSTRLIGHQNAIWIKIPQRIPSAVLHPGYPSGIRLDISPEVPFEIPPGVHRRF